MLTIRLRRTGRTKKPSFRVIVAEKGMPIYGRFVDNIGHVNLQQDPKVIEIDKEKALDWIKKGAQPTETVARLMVKAGILKKEDLDWKKDKKKTKKKGQGKEEEKTPTVATPVASETPAAEASDTKAEQAPKEVVEDKAEALVEEKKEEVAESKDKSKDKPEETVSKESK